MPDTGNSCGCLPKLVHPCINLFKRHSVHPLEPVAPDYSEFITLSANIKLRVIHITPRSIQVPVVNLANKRWSLSEEYWFTRWSKPLKHGICNCSFRRSDRFSSLSESLPIVRESSVKSTDFKKFSNYDVPATRIVNLETFVERLLQDTFFEAFQEFLMHQDGNKTRLHEEQKGELNMGFTSDYDDVVLRRKFSNDAAILHTDCSTVTYSNNQSMVVQSKSEIRLKRPSCDHRSISPRKVKPFVFLFHGIGSSAEVWWPIINSLSNRNYEIVAPDLVGHGFSSAPDKASAYTFQSLLSYTIAVFDHYIELNPNKKSIIIGHSFGCSLATALYKCRSQQIIQLILISGGGPTPLAPPITDNEISVLGCLQTVIKPLLFCGLKRSLFFSSRGKHFGACHENSSVPGHILRYIEKGQSWPEGDTAFHRRILVPTLLVHGLQDTKVTLVQECEMERTIPRAFLELIPNAGHMSMLETPEHLSHMILCFIDWWSY